MRLSELMNFFLTDVTFTSRVTGAIDIIIVVVVVKTTVTTSNRSCGYDD